MLLVLRLLTQALRAPEGSIKSSSSKGRSGAMGVGKGKELSGAQSQDTPGGLNLDWLVPAEEAVTEGEAQSHLRAFLVSFLLEFNSSTVRQEALAALQAAWALLGPHGHRLMLRQLLDLVPSLPAYGGNIAEFMALLRGCLPAVGDAAAAPQGAPHAASGSSSAPSGEPAGLEQVLGALAAKLQQQNHLLANHPNSDLYNRLQVGFRV